MSSSQKHNDGPPRGRWVTSSYSGGSNNCVQMMFPAQPAADGPAVEVRDSKDPDGGTFSFPADVWKGLMATVRNQ